MVLITILFFKWEVDVMRLDNKGMSLAQSLLGFFIYVNIIVFLLSLFNSYLCSNHRIINYKDSLKQEEELSLKIESFQEIIEEVLH